MSSRVGVTMRFKGMVVVTAMVLGGCGGAKPDAVPTLGPRTSEPGAPATEAVAMPAELDVKATPTVAPPTARPRRFRVFEGATPVLDIVDEPGILTSTAPPPPGPYSPPRHPFLTAAALSALHESKLRALLNESKSLDDFVARLKSAGFEVVERAD